MALTIVYIVVIQEEFLMSQLSTDDDVTCSAQALMKLFAVSSQRLIAKFYLFLFYCLLALL